ncbi:MAG: Xaa-Pro peptidase family protein, partial [Pseudomonadota bacterium]
PSWVETAHLPENNSPVAALSSLVPDTETRSRPATFDPAAAYRHLDAALYDRRLRHGRIGLDLSFWPAADLIHLKRVLADLKVLDGSPTLDALAAVKTAEERAALDAAGLLAEAGVIAALDGLCEGMTRDDLASAWQAGVTAAALHKGTQGLEARWEYIAFGTDPWRPSGGLQEGDIVKFDVGTVVDGHSSDSARTFVFGQPSTVQQQVHDALRRGFDAGFTALTPGTPLREVHATVTAAIREAGLPWYTRGHFGHGVGIGVFGEIPPFIAAGTETVAEPGMALAFETPLYVDGLGGFIIEDQVTITDTGATALWSLPHDLVQIPAGG